MDHIAFRFLKNNSAASTLLANGVLMTILLAGCNSQPSAPVSSSGSDTETTTSNKADDDCNDIIDSYFDMVQPDRLGISSEIKSAMTLLNEWRDSCGPPEDAGATTHDVSPELERLVPETYLPELATARFLTRDVIHMRDSLLFRKIAFKTIENSDDELGRIVDLFYYVTRTIAPLPTLEEPIPMSTFDTVIIGRGTVNDRALVYANLLRQLNIDAVIIRPRETASGATGADSDNDETTDEADAANEDGANEQNQPSKPIPPFLIGVISGDNVYLFDPRLGLPIPSKAEAEGTTWDVRLPATLAEVLADESVLNALSTDPENPYPIQSADLKGLRVELIGNIGFWAPRMQSLQDAMSGDRTLLIYDPIEDLPNYKGLLTRVASVNGAPWKKQDIGLWSQPEETIRAIESLEENQYYLQNLFVRKLTLNAPLAVQNQTNQQGQADAQFGRPTGGVYKTRITQVIGNYKEAITSYVSIKLDCRTVEKATFPPEMKNVERDLKQMHFLARDDASFWIAMSQIELQDTKYAEDSLREYARQFAGGRWSMANLSLFSKLLAQQGKYLGAIATLEKAPDFDPQKPSYGYLIQRWQRLAESQETK